MPGNTSPSPPILVTVAPRYRSALFLNDGEVILSLQAIPEPSAIVFFSAAAMMLALWHARRRSRLHLR
ncbi:MAG TPA: hypothetical protein VNQ90_07375 [Chthoniobacteraceae bacterium]|nr:hypothetical protein [Chthoniobacteraceae bacterium]